MSDHESRFASGLPLETPETAIPTGPAAQPVAATESSSPSLPEHLPGSLAIRFETPRLKTTQSLLSATFWHFRRHFVLIAKITLVVFVPIELLKSYLIYQAEVQENLVLVVRVDNLVEGIFGSLVTPALIYALVAVLGDEPAPSLRESFSWGFRQWGRTFGNRFLAGALTILGLIFFVVPGILAAIWFSLVDPVVAVEGDSQRKVLTRSRELVKGHAGTIFLTATGLIVLLFLVSFALGAPLAFVDTWWMNAGIDLALGVFYRIFAVAFLLAYLSFSAGERIADVFD